MESSRNRRVWITGAGGLIGGYLAAHASQAKGWVCHALTRQSLDLADFPAVRSMFQRESPDLVFHCAALTRSDECESNPVLARELNIEVTACLAELCARIPLVFFSTDLVFDGQKGDYDEEGIPNPLSVYGSSKLAAERIVLENPVHLVIRTSLNCGVSSTGDRGFNEQMKRAWVAGKTLNLFSDEFRTPIHAKFTARAVWELSMKSASGIFHVAGAERLSRLEIGRLIATKYSELNPRIKPAQICNFPGLKRPPDTSLNSSKAQRLLSFQLPAFSAWMRTVSGAEI